MFLQSDLCTGDEALGCYLLRLLPEYEDAKIIRSRDPKRLEECNVVLDVGGVYDASKHTAYGVIL